MLLQLIVGPASTLLTLPPKVCVLLLALTSITSGLCLGIPGVQAGKVRTPEHLTISVSFGFALMACAGLVWQFAWPQRMEDNFDLHPWRRKPPSICPYTGADLYSLLPLEGKTRIPLPHRQDAQHAVPGVRDVGTRVRLPYSGAADHLVRWRERARLGQG